MSLTIIRYSLFAAPSKSAFQVLEFIYSSENDGVHLNSKDKESVPDLLRASAECATFIFQT